MRIDQARMVVDYNKWWSIETVYFMFKRTFRESCMAKMLKNIIKELSVKAFIYNEGSYL